MKFGRTGNRRAMLVALLLASTTAGMAAPAKEQAPKPESKYVDRAGKVVLTVPFANGQPFHEGLAAVERDEKIGFIDKTGKVVIAPQFPTIKSQMHINMGKQGCRWQEYDPYIPQCQFSDGLAAVPQKSKTPPFALFGIGIGDPPIKWGYIDKSGKMVIGANFDSAETFHNGYAQVVIDKKVGLIDRTGHISFLEQAEESRLDSPRFEEGVIPLQVSWGRFGYVDVHGNMVIKPKFTSAGSFREGAACVAEGTVKKDAGSTSVSSERYYFIDRSGKPIFAKTFDYAGNFSEGLAPVQINDKWGYINKSGAVAIPLQYRWAYPFQSGIARVSPESGKTFYIDHAGKTVIKPEAGFTNDFSEGLMPLTSHE